MRTYRDDIAEALAGPVIERGSRRRTGAMLAEQSDHGYETKVPDDTFLAPAALKQGPEAMPRHWLAEKARENGLPMLGDRIASPSSAAGIVADGVGGVVNAVKSVANDWSDLVDDASMPGFDPASEKTAERAFNVGGAAMVSGAARHRPSNSVGTFGGIDRSVDALGFYSGTLEAARGLKQSRGTPEQMIAQIRKGGAKQSEIDATGLAQAFEGRPSVTRDELIDHLERNRVSLRENFYRPDADENPAFYQEHSLDPANPTYSERTLYLPDEGMDAATEKLSRFRRELDEAQARGRSTERLERDARRADLALDTYVERLNQKMDDGYHFPDPNIIGHTQTSQALHEGRPVFLIDQLQSDWGQMLRGADEHRNLPRHPLVNSTDQWTNTTLRRAVQHAIDAGADHIAIPSGKTVLGYNPGSERGMSVFYDQIAPKNLGSILAKLDPAIAPVRVPTLDSPTGAKGLGSGFTLFPLTQRAKAAAKKGLPLFSAGGAVLLSEEDDGKRPP